MRLLNPHLVEFTHFCLFSGSGGASLGLNRGHARVGTMRAQMRCLGGVDSMPEAVADFGRLTGTPGTCLDLFDEQDYRDFHGTAPPAGWRECTPADILAAAGGEHPDVVFTSPPCKGFSGLLNSKSAASAKYQALNNLTVRGFMLMLQAFADDPPALICMENVPRIASRGRPLLDVITALLASHGYAVAETVHDCGQLGGLAQHRKRYLLVARHRAKVRPFLYEPPKRRVRSVGEVLGDLPMPETTDDPMHALPRLQWQTWVRLALIEAGKDWRSLNRLRVVDGQLADLGIAPADPSEWHGGVFGVKGWDEASGTVTSRCGPTNGAFTVADPRAPRDLGRYEPYGVVAWKHTGHTVTSQAAPGAGPYSVADPRLGGVRHNNVYRVVRWDTRSPTVTSGSNPSAGGLAVADPRATSSRGGDSKHRVTGWDEASGTVVGKSQAHQGATAVADPRPGWSKREGGDWQNSGHYGVTDWREPSATVTGTAKHDRGAFSVADPRPLPALTDRPDPVPRIVSLDETWHRPFTTLELAALQGFPVTREDWGLAGSSHGGWRMRIGNAVPPPAAEAIGNVMAETLLLEQLGEGFRLSPDPIWVTPLRIALGVDLPEQVMS